MSLKLDRHRPLTTRTTPIIYTPPIRPAPYPLLLCSHLTSHLSPQKQHEYCYLLHHSSNKPHRPNNSPVCNLSTRAYNGQHHCPALYSRRVWRSLLHALLRCPCPFGRISPRGRVRPDTQHIPPKRARYGRSWARPRPLHPRVPHRVCAHRGFHPRSAPGPAAAAIAHPVHSPAGRGPLRRRADYPPRHGRGDAGGGELRPHYYQPPAAAPPAPPLSPRFSGLRAVPTGCPGSLRIAATARAPARPPRRERAPQQRVRVWTPDDAQAFWRCARIREERALARARARRVRLALPRCPGGVRGAAVAVPVQIGLFTFHTLL
ncbi:hypothetical protein BKA93DRAFT_763110 [Sparassis latifolia]